MVLLGKDLKYDGHWVQVYLVTYKNENGNIKEYEVVERKNSQAPNAVVILALSPSGQILVCSEYRPPTGARCWQFPAGLIDHHLGETAESAALRELEEETGLRGTLASVLSDTVFNDPGLSSATTVYVKVLVDDSALTERTGQDKFIEFIWVDVDDLINLVKGKVVDARLSSFVLGISLAKQSNHD